MSRSQTELRERPDLIQPSSIWPCILSPSAADAGGTEEQNERCSDTFSVLSPCPDTQWLSGFLNTRSFSPLGGLFSLFCLNFSPPMPGGSATASCTKSLPRSPATCGSFLCAGEESLRGSQSPSLPSVGFSYSSIFPFQPVFGLKSHHFHACFLLEHLCAPGPIQFPSILRAIPMLVCGPFGVLCLLPCFFSSLLSCFCNEARKSSTSYMVPLTVNNNTPTPFPPFPALSNADSFFR